MRRIVVVAVCGLLAGGGAGALARKGPPKRHHAPPKHHAHHRKRARKNAVAKRKPATAPVAPVTTPVPAPATPTSPAAPDQTTPTTPTTPVAPAAPLAHTLGVTAADAPDGSFTLSLSRTVLGEGPELIQFRNASQDAHDLRIDAPGDVEQAAWDELESLAVPVAQTVPLVAGSYRVYCTLHLGMERQLTVKAG
jgi:plastocyanin